MASTIDVQSPAYKRVSKCIASMIRSHRANASKDGLCPQVIISCYRLRHRWSPKAQTDAQLQNEEFVKSVLDQMIEDHILVEVSQADAPSTRSLSTTIEQRYILNANVEVESCRADQSCNDMLSSWISVPAQIVFDASLPSSSNTDRKYVSMSELEPNASRFFSPANTNIDILGSSTQASSRKRRRTSGLYNNSSRMGLSSSEKVNQANPQSLAIALSAHGLHQGELGPRSLEAVLNKTQSDAEKLAHEVANLPWLTSGLQELIEKYPDDLYELVYEDDLTQIKCHDCKGRLYKIHYQNCDVSNMEWHAKSTVHADRVERRIAGMGRQLTLTEWVKKRHEALEAARRKAPERFRKAHQKPINSIQPPAQKPAPRRHPTPWNADLRRETSEQFSMSDQYQQHPKPSEKSYSAQQKYELKSPSGTPPPSRNSVVDSTPNGPPISAIQQLQWRIGELEQDGKSSERTISMLKDKVHNQQQVNNTHQAVIRDLILRIQALEKKDQEMQPEIRNLKNQIPLLQEGAESQNTRDEEVAGRVSNLEIEMQLVNEQVSHLSSNFMSGHHAGNVDGDEAIIETPSNTGASKTGRPRGRPRKLKEGIHM